MAVPGLLTDLSPLIVRRVVGMLSNDEMTAQLEALSEHLAAAARAHQRTVTLVDLSRAAPMTAVQRKLQAEWVARNATLLREVSLGTAFIVESMLVRGALTAIFWLNPPPHPYEIVATTDLALDWAIAALDRAGVGIARDLTRQRVRTYLGH